MRLPAPKRPRTVSVVYAEEFLQTGASVMRGQQLADLIKKFHLADEVQYVPLELGFANQTLFITKGALYKLDPERLAAWRRRGNKLIFDPIESPVPYFARAYADVLVACSEKARQEYTRAFPKMKVLLLDHHVDPRIAGLTFPPKTAFTVGYFGELANTIVTTKIKTKVDFIAVDNLKQNAAWMARLPNYAMHYAVRQTLKENRYKPFLKGFTAAHCDAAVMVQDSETDAVRWLGEDYPYLIKGEAAEAVILATLQSAAETFGGPEWKRAMAVMQHIKAATSEASIAAQLKRILREAQ